MSEATVCILAAGLGKRMGKLTHHLPKALLQIGGKAAISHVIEAFPAQAKFVVAVGHKAHLVEEYLALAHPKREIRCVPVDPYCGPGSGPGVSALRCRRYLPESFFLACCDTFWSTPFSALPTNRSWIGVCRVEPEETASYCNVTVNEDGRVEGFRDKQQMGQEALQSFVGLAFLRQSEPFFRALAGLDGNEREVQLASGFRAVASDDALHALSIPSWVDVGTEDRLRAHRAHLSDREFEKHGEEIYVSPSGVIKFFAEARIVTNRVVRSRQLSGLVPPVTSRSDNFYRYDFVPGGTFYERGTPVKFDRLLKWLEESLWLPVPGVSAEEFRSRAHDFYFEKTLQRLKPFGAAQPELPDEIASSVDWPLLFSAQPTRFHGDLNLANILIRDGSEDFLLIDWRHDFGGATTFGDLGYDLAKLLASSRVDFSGTNRKVQRGPLPTPMHSAAYERRLTAFLEQNGIDRRRIETIVALIFLNMAGIHLPPLGDFFFRLGLEALRNLGSDRRADIYRNAP